MVKPKYWNESASKMYINCNALHYGPMATLQTNLRTVKSYVSICSIEYKLQNYQYTCQSSFNCKDYVTES